MPSGDIVAAGDTDSACPRVAGERDAWLAVLSPDGALKHHYCFGGDDLDELQNATPAGDTMWVTGRTRSTRFSSRWTGALKLARGYDRTFVAQVNPSARSLTSAHALTPHVGRGNGLARGSDGSIYAVGETTDAGGRFIVPTGSQLAPTKGAFSTGAARGTTDQYLIAFR
jgi:hypothetical protein